MTSLSVLRPLPQDRPLLGLAAGAGLFALASGLHREQLERLDGPDLPSFGGMAVVLDRSSSVLPLGPSLPASGVSCEAVADRLLGLRLVPPAP